MFNRIRIHSYYKRTFRLHGNTHGQKQGNWQDNMGAANVCRGCWEHASCTLESKFDATGDRSKLAPFAATQEATDRTKYTGPTHDRSRWSKGGGRYRSAALKCVLVQRAGDIDHKPAQRGRIGSSNMGTNTQTHNTTHQSERCRRPRCANIRACNC